MAAENTYLGFDLKTITQDDLYSEFPEFEPIIIDPEREVTDDEYRILEVYCYARNYELKELVDLLESNYSEILLSN